MKVASPNSRQGYMEIGFTEDAGVLDPGGYSYIRARFSLDNWDNFSQYSDPSFNRIGSTYMDKIAVYCGEDLIEGNPQY